MSATDHTLTDAEDDALGGMLLAVWGAPSARQFATAVEVVQKHIESILANHVAAAREADRAEVADLRERITTHCEERDAALVELADTEERLAGLMAKIEALADRWHDYGRTAPTDVDQRRWWSVEASLRALLPADAATALDAVREEAKAEERERIAQAIEAGVLPSHPNEGYKDGFRRAADIARHTPEAT